MALEAQPVRRDDAVELVQRREADRGFRRRGQPRHGAAHDILLVFRRRAVGAHRRRRRRARASSRRRWAAGSSDRRARPARSRPPPPSRRRRQEAAARCLGFVGRLCHRPAPGGLCQPLLSHSISRMHSPPCRYAPEIFTARVRRDAHGLLAARCSARPVPRPAALRCLRSRSPSRRRCIPFAARSACRILSSVMPEMRCAHRL